MIEIPKEEQTNIKHPSANSLTITSQQQLPDQQQHHPHMQITFQFHSPFCIGVLVLAMLLMAYVFGWYLYRAITIKSLSTVYAGQLHYSRIPYQYWQHRMLMAKSMGLNALSVYVMWNYHQLTRGQFDYSSNDKNLPAFLQLAKKNKLSVLIRPGPYVCAQWDMGGMPARLYSIHGLKVRQYNSKFLQEVRIYFTQLSQIIRPYINDGTIIMLQIQNQYGFFGTDKRYIESIKAIWKDLNINLPQYYVDWTENLHKTHWDGANVGINNGNLDLYYKYFKLTEPKSFMFGGEVYSGWMTCWGEDWAIKPLDVFKKKYKQLLTYGYSFAIYMVHGGTNFGLTAGANSYHLQSYDYLPILTSYDYDAPINEQGNRTAKFDMLRQLILGYTKWQVPQPPSPIPMIQIPSFTPNIFATLFQNLPPPSLTNLDYPPLFQSNQLKMWHQGLVLYEFKLPKGSYLATMTVRDYAIIFINNQFITTVDRSERISHPVNLFCLQQTNTIRILVQAMGHINWDRGIQQDLKGISQFDLRTGNLDKVTDIKWDITKVLLNQTINNQTFNKIGSVKYPTFSQANFNLQTVGDTYFNLQKYGKGYLWINGRNLGRFWKKGPQKKLFCPGVWLKSGNNQLIVLDLISQNTYPIKGQLTLF